jgi:hypothetical protein
MLKRHGEPCQYQVPGFAGRLTETEHTAYAEAVGSVEDQLKQFNEAVTALTEAEKQIPNWPELVANGSTEQAQVISVQGNKGAPWQILRTLSKTSRNEVFFCARPSENGREFGIIEKFDPNSAYARVHGSSEVLMTSNDAHLLLQDHLENERAILHLFRKDIEATVEESLSEKYPGQNLSRVIKAVGSRCSNNIPAAPRKSRTHAITNNVKIRF